METLIAIVAGVALSAACGFRVFVPLLFASGAAAAGHLEFAEGFEWLGTWPAVVAFGVATLLEAGAYLVPWLDHALDTLAVPAAVVAGAVLTGAFTGDVSPWLRWTLMVVAGGGAAGVVAGGMAVARGASTALTGGLANPVFSWLETTAAVVVAALAVLVPVAALVAAGAAVFAVVRRTRRVAAG